MLSRVDLPQPDGPTSTRKPPFSSVMSMPFRISSAAEPLAERADFEEWPWLYPFTAPAIRPRTK